MYIEIKCRSCGKSFCVDFSSNEYDVDRCPKCGVHLSSSDVSRIRAITEPLYINVNKLNSVKVCGVHMEEGCAAGTAEMANDLFLSDMEHLNEIYHSASPEVQNRLASLIDQFYLLVNNDARTANAAKLDASLENLHKLFMNKVDAKYKETAQILELDQGY